MTANLAARRHGLSRLLFGTLTMGPLQANLPICTGAGLLAYASQCGVHDVDTAELYQTYPYIAQAIADGASLNVHTRTYAYARDDAERAVKNALAETSATHLSSMLLHEQEGEATLQGHREALSTFIDCKLKGIIRAVGISTHHIAGVKAAMKRPDIDIIFAPLNRRGMGIVDGSWEAMRDALGEAASREKRVWLMKVLAGGHLIQDREAAFDFALGQTYADKIALGMQSFHEIDYAVAVFSGKEPSQACKDATATTARRLIVEPWCSGCGACVRRCDQHALCIANGQAVPDLSLCVRCGYCAAVCPDCCLKVI